MLKKVKYLLYIAILIILTSIVLLTACSKTEVSSEMNSNELYTVSVRLNQIEQSAKPITKATTTLPDTLRLRVTMNVFDQQGQFAYSDKILLNETGSEIPVQFQVKKGTYDLAFWADYVLYKNETIVSEAYNAADLRNISINNAMSSDAFSLVINDVVVDGDVAITSGTELSRAVAMLKIESDQTIPADFASIQYSLSQSVSSINLLTGESTINSYGTFFSNPLTAGETLSVSRYIFPSEPFTCSINLLDQNGTSITNFDVENVETQKNVQTILRGDFFSENASSGSLSLTLNQEWDADKIYVVEPMLTAIPIADANFKAYLVANFDTDGDGEISTTEAEQVTTIYVTTDDIYSLDGIEYFTNLTQLTCCGNFNEGKLSSIVLSNNTQLNLLNCSGNQLTELNIRNCTQITNLQCNKNSLSQLDLSNNIQLIDLNCWENQLTELNLSNNTKLTELYCGLNQLTQLDLSNNVQLIYLNCSENQLTELNLSNNTKLTELYCGLNQLSQLDLNNNTDLTSLSCYNNQFTQIDLSRNTKLTDLECFNNELTQLDLSNNNELISLNCDSNDITDLNLNNNKKLIELSCYGNKLTQIHLSNCTELTNINCARNLLTTIDINNNSQLTELWCSNNQLIQINLENNILLSELICTSNQLSQLDLYNNTELTELQCSNNKLTQLYLNNNTKLTYIRCENNQLSILDLTENTELQELWCKNNLLSQLDLSNATKLFYANCGINQLTEIDLSNNTALQSINLADNPLETIYVFDGYSFSLNKPETTQVVVK